MTTPPRGIPSSSRPAGDSATTNHPSSAECPTLPITRGCPFAEPEEFTRLRAERPVARATLPDGRGVWLLTRHEDVRALLAHPHVSSDRRHPGFPLLARIDKQAMPAFPTAMIGLDGAAHAASRRPVLGEFTVKRINTLRPRIQEIVDDALDAMLAAGSPADLVAALSLPVPSLVICELLGVPYADHDFFQARTMLLVSRSADPADRARGVRELRGYLSDLVTAKATDPGDDLLGRQIARRRADGTYDHDDLVSLAFLLLIAGHETTANMISLATVALLTEPDKLAAIRDDPSRTPRAVEELLRYFTIADSVTSRVATADIEIGGQLIRSGEGVIAFGLAADHDPSVFERPDELDFDRGAAHHVAFGYGVHQCLGQNLARVELQIVLDTLLRRIPTLRLDAGIEAIPFKQDAQIYGCYELPVAW